MMDTVQILKELFEQKGIFISEDEFDEDLQMDSIQFVTLVIAIEERFSIEIDSSYFTQYELHTFNGFVQLVNRSVNPSD